MIIDDATFEDLDAIVAFEDSFPPKERWSRDSWAEELRNPHRVILAARDYRHPFPEPRSSSGPRPDRRVAAGGRVSRRGEGISFPEPRSSSGPRSGRIETQVQDVLGILVLAPGPDVTDLMRIVVARDCMRQGVADQLMDAGFERCPGRWLLEVRDDNAPALRLYDKHGFTTIDRRADYYGAGVDALILERRDDE